MVRKYFSSLSLSLVFLARCVYEVVGGGEWRRGGVCFSSPEGSDWEVLMFVDMKRTGRMSWAEQT